MSDERENADPAASARSPESVGLAWAAMGAASQIKADKFLDVQTRLAQKQAAIADLQIDELKREDRLRHWSLLVRHTSDVLRLSFQLALALIFTGIVVIIGAAIWNAANDNGLVIESFSVPPDMVAKGLTGDVVAAKVLDRLSAMEAQTESRRAASSYANDWGKDIKVQIPDTGVSIGEINNYLHEWLGRQTRISGEVYRTASGIAVTARAGSEASPTFAGSEADLDKLLQKAAESVYRAAQPYRYAVYLGEQGRFAEAQTVLQELVRTGSPDDRAWAYVGLSALLSGKVDLTGAAAMARRAIAIEPDFALAYANLAGAEGSLQHDEQALAAWRQTVALDDRGENRDLDSSYAADATFSDKQNLASAESDNLQTLEYGSKILALPDRNGDWEPAWMNNLQACGVLHDAACARNVWAALPATKGGLTLLSRDGNMQLADFLMGHWQAVVSESRGITAALGKLGKLVAFAVIVDEDPVVAATDAELGDFKAAHALIDKTPLDSIACLRMRGRIDALQKNWNGADSWYARAAKAAPSSPVVWTDWGHALLMKGDNDGAIARFTVANEKGPHFADPLEMWGEALIVKSRSDLALAKFAEADKYAPNWGRLHLKWGEALWWSGDRQDARKQFAIASHLDLTTAENRALARMQRAAGAGTPPNRGTRT